MTKREDKQSKTEMKTIDRNQLDGVNGGIVPLLVAGGLALGALLLWPSTAR